MLRETQPQVAVRNECDILLLRYLTGLRRHLTRRRHNYGCLSFFQYAILALHLRAVAVAGRCDDLHRTITCVFEGMCCALRVL